MNLVKFEDGKKVTDLKLIAEYFNKQKQHLLRDIRNLINTDPTLESEYIPYQYKDSYGRKQNTYLITEEGFTLLCMGFTGSKALKWKREFYKAFKTLQDENSKLGNYLNTINNTNMTYCITDLCCKFKNLLPYQANLYLLERGIIEKRASGYYPNIHCLEWAVSATAWDGEQLQNYVRYTPKGMETIYNLLLNDGYEEV